MFVRSTDGGQHNLSRTSDDGWFAETSCLGVGSLRLPDTCAGEAKYSHLAADTDLVEFEWGCPPRSNPL